MLEHFLEASYTKTKQAEAAASLAAALENLPEELLHKLARGKEKLAYCGDDSSWLDKFKGTPLFQKAYDMEKQELELRMAERSQRLEGQAVYREVDALRDEISVKRKMLELELAGMEEGVEGPAEIEEPPESIEGPVDVPPEQEEGSPVENKEASVDLNFAIAKMKLAFAVTEKGHEFDAKRHRLLAEQAAQRAGASAKKVDKSKEAMAKEAFTAALAKGLLGSAGKALKGAGGTLVQGAKRTGAAFQRGGLSAGARTAGRSALTFAGKHPGVAAGAAGLGTGLIAGRASG